MRNHFFLFILFSSFFISSTCASSFFQIKRTLEIELEVNLSELLLGKKFYYWNKGHNKFLKGKLFLKKRKSPLKIFVQNGGDLNFYDDLPPLNIKFPHNNILRHNPFKGLKNLTLITHGKINEGQFQKTLNHFISYKQFSILSPFSYNVRPVQIKYRDSSGSLNPFYGWGFFVEPNNNILRRFPFKKIQKNLNLNKRYFSPQQMALIHVFNFFIQDSNRFILNNKSPSHSKTDFFSFNYREILPIPFNFDQSKIYWLSQQAPEEINSILESSFSKKIWLQIPGLKYQHIKKAFKMLKSKKNKFKNIYLDKNIPLKDHERKAYINYINLFFNFLKNKF
jgi:hypothetical protein